MVWTPALICVDHAHGRYALPCVTCTSMFTSNSCCNMCTFAQRLVVVKHCYFASTYIFTGISHLSYFSSSHCLPTTAPIHTHYIRPGYHHTKSCALSLAPLTLSNPSHIIRFEHNVAWQLMQVHTYDLQPSHAYIQQSINHADLHGTVVLTENPTSTIQNYTHNTTQTTVSNSLSFAPCGHMLRGPSTIIPQWTDVEHLVWDLTSIEVRTIESTMDACTPAIAVIPSGKERVVESPAATSARSSLVVSTVTMVCSGNWALLPYQTLQSPCLPPQVPPQRFQVLPRHHTISSTPLWAPFLPLPIEATQLTGLCGTTWPRPVQVR